MEVGERIIDSRDGCLVVLYSKAVERGMDELWKVRIPRR